MRLSHCVHLATQTQITPFTSLQNCKMFLRNYGNKLNPLSHIHVLSYSISLPQKVLCCLCNLFGLIKPVQRCETQSSQVWSIWPCPSHNTAHTMREHDEALRIMSCFIPSSDFSLLIIQIKVYIGFICPKNQTPELKRLFQMFFWQSLI